MRCSLLVCVVYITREWPFHHTSHESSWMSELQSATGSFQANFISRLSWGIKEFGGHPYMISSLLSYIVTPTSHASSFSIGTHIVASGRAVMLLFVIEPYCVYALSNFPKFLTPPPTPKWGWRHLWMTLGTIANYSCFILCFIPAIHTADSLRFPDFNRLILTTILSIISK